MLPLQKYMSDIRVRNKDIDEELQQVMVKAGAIKPETAVTIEHLRDAYKKLMGKELPIAGDMRSQMCFLASIPFVGSFSNNYGNFFLYLMKESPAYADAKIQAAFNEEAAEHNKKPDEIKQKVTKAEAVENAAEMAQASGENMLKKHAKKITTMADIAEDFETKDDSIDKELAAGLVPSVSHLHLGPDDIDTPVMQDMSQVSYDDYDDDEELTMVYNYDEAD